MSDRREEGSLGDPQNQQEAQKGAARIRRQNREDILTLERNPHFRRWFGRFAVGTLMLDLRTSNGGDLQHFSGRRSLILEMTREFEDEVPGFYERILGTRRVLENELRPEPQGDD